jgi:hypothetical protein
MIRRYGLLAILIVIIGIQVLYNVGTTGSVLGDQANISMSALLSETNRARRDNNLEDLRLSKRLSEAARLKAADMLDKQYWAHDAPDGTKPRKWFEDVDYSYAEAGENLAKNFYTAEATMTAWMHSPEHRANILEPRYTDVGFAVITGELDGSQATIIVALYGHPADTTVAGGVSVAGARSQPFDLLTRLGVGLQSMTPAALGSIIVLFLVAFIAFIAHLYRHHLPKAAHQSWHRHHHGAVKMGGMFSLILIMLLLYGGGQV